MLQEFSSLLDIHGIQYTKKIDYSQLDSPENLMKIIGIQTKKSFVMVALPTEKSIDFNAFKNHHGSDIVKVYKSNYIEDVTSATNMSTQDNSSKNTILYIDENPPQSKPLVFYSKFYDDSIQVRIQDLNQYQKIEMAPFLIPRSYRGIARRFYPESAKNDIHQHKKCILGFSMENASFSPKKVESMVAWINKNFERCKVVIGDSIHRSTLQINHDISQKEALEKSMLMAKNIADEYHDVFMASSNSCKFEYTFCSDVQLFNDYDDHLKQLWALVESDENFASAVHDFSKYFVNRRNQSSEDYLRLSSTYLIEELAIFSSLAKAGWPVFIYPGNLCIFQEISEGKHSEAPTALKNLINIELDLRSRGPV